MKPFLLLQIRPLDKASDNEYEGFLQFTGLTPENLHRCRIEQNGVPEINLNNYSGILVGGGPSNVSDSQEKKSEIQKKFEAQLYSLLDEIVEKDFPYFGTCYGHGILASHQGVTVSTEKYGESVMPVEITLTPEGKKDKLLQDIPHKFLALVGHKESAQHVVDSTILLASSEICPIHMIRVKNNVYSTQFHPEADIEGFCLRIDIYKNKGYFPPEEAEPLKEQLRKSTVTVPGKILRNFIEKYAQA